ncbi:MAG: anaerobic glycerol-3-phosphate dehydrogenase subunit GlpB [Desulfobacterota bacterium]|nr:anaerobic glycerol-3-phosphate dehydrogenase subunit GlpB [Thermodesulfobacteriota bacterium]
MHYDLIVIGMGLSGLMAAKTAVEAGRKVLVVGKGMGGLTLFSNTIDLLGTPLEGGKMREALNGWVHDHPEHPYARVGVEKIEEALSSFGVLFPPPYTFEARDGRNSLIPTGAGTFRPTYLVPSTLMRGIHLREKRTLIVGFKGLRDFHPRRLADLYGSRQTTLPLPGDFGTEVSALALARWMEQPPFREFVAGEIKAVLKGEEMVGLPAVLGIRDPMRARRDLEKRLGVAVFEIPILPPSIPGLRIFGRFKEWLIRRGATFLQGHWVSKATLKGKRCEGIEIGHPPVTRLDTAEQYIVATGRFMGGGLMADRDRVWEPLFHLPVFPFLSPRDWFGASFFDDHPIHRMGISTDASFRPLDERGNIVLENVRIAGTLLAGHHFLKEKSREGIEIVTGYWAAKYAFP